MNEIPQNVRQEFVCMTNDDRLTLVTLLSRYSPQTLCYAVNIMHKKLEELRARNRRELRPNTEGV